MNEDTQPRSDRPNRPEKSDEDPTDKTQLDKPATGEEAIAIDEQGPKNIRGPEGHAKKDRQG